MNVNSAEQKTKKLVLGKGIAALLGENYVDSEEHKTGPIEPVLNNKQNPSTNLNNYYNPILVPLSKIQLNPHQPRKVFKEKDIEELANSIRENGIVQPLVVAIDEVTQHFELIAGERRYRAAKHIGLELVPIVVKRGTKKEKLVMSIIENVQRADLNCVEEALAYFQLMEEFQLTQEEVAKKIGKDRSTIANFLRLLKLPKEIVMMLQKELLTFGHAKILASIKNDQESLRVAQIVIAKQFSVRDLEEYLKTSHTQDHVNQKNISHDDVGKYFKEKMEIYKQKIEKKTGFHVEIKSNGKGSGHLVFKFQNEAEFKDVYDFILNQKGN